MTGSNRIATFNDASLGRAVEILRAGGIVAIPTETVYGLAADASRADAVAEIYRAKGRPSFNPLIVHVTDRVRAEQLTMFNGLARRLADAFWPGPLTMVLPKREGAPVAAAVTAGLDTLALRCPAHPVMQAVLRASGLDLAAPSANRSGAISPTRAAHVAASLGDRVDLVLDAGPCAEGLESTIVAVRGEDYAVLRPGPVTAAMLADIAGRPAIAAPHGKIEAPGQLASHYAPSKPVRLNVTMPDADEWMIGFGALAGDDNLSPVGDLAVAAARLFDCLHQADASAKPRIAIAPVAEEGIGVAINDRLRRAAA